MQKNSVIPQFLVRDQSIWNALLSNNFSSLPQMFSELIDEISIESITLMDRTGQIVAVAGKENLNVNSSNKIIFNTAISTNDTVMNIIEKDENEFGFFYSRKIENDQRVLGVLSIEVDLKKFENGFKDIIKVIDNTYDVSHSHATTADNRPLGDFFHTHKGPALDTNTNPVNFSTAGGMVTPHTHTGDTAPYPAIGIDRNNLVDEAPAGSASGKIHMFNNTESVTNWSFRDDHWESIPITSSNLTSTNVNDAITELESLIENIKNITVKLKDEYNSRSILGCSKNLGKATSGTCITDNNLSVIMFLTILVKVKYI